MLEFLTKPIFEFIKKNEFFETVGNLKGQIIVLQEQINDLQEQINNLNGNVEGHYNYHNSGLMKVIIDEVRKEINRQKLLRQHLV